MLRRSKKPCKLVLADLRCIRFQRLAQCLLTAARPEVDNCRSTLLRAVSLLAARLELCRYADREMKTRKRELEREKKQDATMENISYKHEKQARERSKRERERVSLQRKG